MNRNSKQYLTNNINRSTYYCKRNTVCLERNRKSIYVNMNKKGDMCKCQYNFAGFGLNNNVGKPAFLFSPFCLLKVSDPSSGMTDR